MAQPGIWQAGGTGTYSLLYPEDSSAYRKIQMVNEHVVVKLYPGFAAVKGTYWMYNDEEDTLVLESGYPVNTTYDGEYNYDRAEVFFDDLYALKVYQNGQLLTPNREERMDEYGYSYNNNWYIWNSVFPPKDTTVFTVYFLVNCSNADVRQGYTSEDANGFIYLFESGASWKQPIVRGYIQVQLSDEINWADIKGVSASGMLMQNQEHQIISSSFTNFYPTTNDNFIITYKPVLGEFDFAKHVAKAEQYFNELESIENLDGITFETPYFNSPFEHEDYHMGPFTMILIGLVVGFLLFLVLIFYVVRAIIKIMRN